MSTGLSNRLRRESRRRLLRHHLSASLPHDLRLPARGEHRVLLRLRPPRLWLQAPPLRLPARRWERRDGGRGTRRRRRWGATANCADDKATATGTSSSRAPAPFDDQEAAPGLGRLRRRRQQPRTTTTCQDTEARLRGCLPWRRSPRPPNRRRHPRPQPPVTRQDKPHRRRPGAEARPAPRPEVPRRHLQVQPQTTPFRKTQLNSY
mmetsp:Transcript_26314/g.85129  ORF Transcript_26314/g.85129 Transcript_26314/m.85129 type:complete len:206 (+) Transcript_26314:569-1186(+)